MDWLSNKQKKNRIPRVAVMAIGDRAIQLNATSIETVGCSGGEETLFPGSESAPEGQRLSGLQGFVNLGACFLAWASENHGIVPEGKTASDIPSRSSLSSDGSTRCHLIAETADNISIMWLGWVFSCDGESIRMQQGDPLTAQSWADRAQYVMDFYAAHGIYPMGVE